MKGKERTFIYTIVVSVLLLASLLTAIFASSGSGRPEGVVFTATSDKNEILLGEVVNLEFEFTNLSPTSVRIPVGGVMAGNIQVLVAKKGGSFRKYFRSDWGRLDGEVNSLTLAPNQRQKVDSSNATILWNGKPDYSHLNAVAAEAASKQDNRILTDYAFPEAGTYLVKATSCLIDELRGCSIPVESEPIEIRVHEPIGEDLEVWNQIRGNREIAMLMQKGLFTSGKETEREQNTTLVEQIIVRHPNSVYSNYLKVNLANSRIRGAKRDEFYKDIKQPQKP